MATKRRPLHPGSAGQTTAASSTSSTHLNFRPGGTDTSRTEAKGTRPTTAPTTVNEVIMMMIMHVCKRTIFFDVNLKVALYLGSLFLVSLIGDFLPYPRTYFARSDNLFNVYFVKMGWGWTLLFATPFLVMTSHILCCGNNQRMIKHHLLRIIIATFFWFTWTKLFNIIENAYGRCNVRNYDSKSSCLKAGHFWNGFDISGHAFILIYSSLVLIEEARPIVGWEYIKEHLRDEEHNRSTGEKSLTNPLRNLKDKDFKSLKFLYEKYTPTIRLLFIGASALQLLWDVMLVCTMLYYHKMIEKVLSGIFAILTWYFCYRVWYPSLSFLPDSAGRGLFLYQKNKATVQPVRRSGSITSQSRTSAPSSGSSDLPKFMGMPLYGLNQPQPPPPTTTQTSSQRGDESSQNNTSFSKYDLNYRFQDQY